jgi:ADP-ribosyl-[dinitrogen reductase] hydrolase
MKFPSPDAHVLPATIPCESPPTKSSDAETVKRVVGSMVGLAVGDALGASVEFRPRQYLVDHPVHDLQGGGTWGLEAGQWTDDTSMALCLASSLITHHGYNPYDQMVRYKWWYKKGFLSSTGQCFDIGSTTRTSLEEFCLRQNTLKQRFPNATDEDIDNMPLEGVRSVTNFSECCGVPEQAGNGPLMRLAPVPLFYFRQPEVAVRLAGESARLTHGDQKAVDACRYYAALIVAAVHGESKEELLNNQFYEKHQQWFGSNKLQDEVLLVARGSYKKPRGYEDGIRGKNYIVNTLEAALWAFWADENSFKKGVLLAVNLGDDTDTTAAVYGQLAGAHYNISNIPYSWVKPLYASNLLICISEWLYFEGGQGRNDTPQQRQQQRTPQQNQTRVPVSKLAQSYGANPSSHQTSPRAPMERMGYGYPSQQKQPQYAGTQASSQIPHNTTPNNSGSRHQKQKMDPSKMPAAGLRSGTSHN